MSMTATRAPPRREQAHREPLDEAEFKRELVALIPQLRAFARSLALNHAAADDLVQDSLMRAWRARRRYEAGTHFKAWAFTILRNQFYSEKRRSWRQLHLSDETAERTLIAPSNPDAAIELDELRRALGRIPEELREALILVGAGGFSYDEAAAICACPTGTIKSRVSRARRSLEDILDVGFSPSDEGGRASGAMDAILDDVRRLADGDR
jgi:RNA polymerase sigma-70 factor (ECF subfamily)